MMMLLMFTSLPLVLLAAATWERAEPENVRSPSDETVADKTKLLAHKQELTARVRSETRDPAWAAQAEALLRKAYAATGPHVAVEGSITVRCGSTICEVVGLAKPYESNNLKKDVEDFGRAKSALYEGLVARGLKPDLELHTVNQTDKMDHFESYYLRR